MKPERRQSRRGGIRAVCALGVGTVLVGSCFMTRGALAGSDSLHCDDDSTTIELSGTMQTVQDVYGKSGEKLGFLAIRRAETQLSVGIQDISAYGELKINKIEFSEPQKITPALEFSERLNGTYWTIDADDNLVVVKGSC